jgi:hypothetical protein
MLIRIVSSYFVCGIVLQADLFGDFLVSKAAPIVKYMNGWTYDRVKDYCWKKGWDYEELK